MANELTIADVAPALALAPAESAALFPHEFLLAVSRGETFDGVTPALADRIAAAKAVAPYFAPRLATVAHVGPDGGPIRHSIEVRFIRPGEVSTSASAKSGSAEIRPGEALP